jgi:lambda repressor-like predicted transcriptional regulator
MNNLKAIRAARDLALWGLAARARVSATTLSAVERWDYLPGPGVRQRVAVALGVPATDIWPEDAGEGAESAVAAR